MSSNGALEITLERDGQQQPWGFRLQGGQDVGVMLSVQRILVGTPSEGVLRMGDILHTVGKFDARNMTHQQAADLFTNAGNQIKITIKRAGASSSQSSGQKGQQGARTAPASPPVSGGVALPGMTPPITTNAQPYRTTPIIQPGPKVYLPDVGPGSKAHLRNQDDHLTGVKEPCSAPESPQVKIVEFALQQKVTGTLQQIQQTGPQGFGVQQQQPQQQSAPINCSSPVPAPSPQPILKASPSPVPAYQSPPVSCSPQGLQVGAEKKVQYNSPIKLYSSENVEVVAKMNQAGTNPGRMINPVNKPPKHWSAAGGLPKSYVPEESATWRAINELENCQMVTEHDAPDAKLYSLNTSTKQSTN